MKSCDFYLLIFSFLKIQRHGVLKNFIPYDALPHKMYATLNRNLLLYADNFRLCY